MEKKYLVLAVVVTTLVILGIGEGVKANNRKAALNDLNKVYSTLKTDNEKIAAVVKTNAIIASNRSLLDFSKSKANDEPPMLEDGDINWIIRQIEANVTVSDVTTVEVWFNPVSQQWEEFR